MGWPQDFSRRLEEEAKFVNSLLQRRPSGGGHGQPGDMVSSGDLTGPLGCPRLGTAANKTPLTKMEVIV
ncbi:hypothetical protein WMY93_012085 [Mugilogobius chulae]|uniref:Uncharacterized protein n=1 Tax=Mugilogobius chulae TaxID=88201 RepID=A0AAW0P847_9GOBI